MLQFIAALDLKCAQFVFEFGEVVGGPNSALALLVEGGRVRLLLFYVAVVVASPVGLLLVPGVHVVAVDAPVSLHSLIVPILGYRGAVVQVVGAVAPVVVFCLQC